MLNPITAAYVDPRISDIRNAVNQKTDAIPFLLMPVRIETRFMQVPGTSTQVQPPSGSLQSLASFTTETSLSTEKVMEDIGNLNIQAVTTQSKLSGVTLRAVSTEADRITQSVRGLRLISIKEKGWLKQLCNSLDTDAQQLARAAAGVYVEDAKKLTETIALLRKSIDAAPHQKVKTSPAVTELIEKMTKVDVEFDTLTSKREKIPYLNIKNKKDLYIYVTKVLEKAQRFYAEAEARSAGIPSLSKNQTNRMSELQRNIQTKLVRFQKQVAGIHGDRNWQQFVEETVGKKVAELTASGERFSGTVIPKLASRPQPVDLDAGDIFLHGIQTMVKIKRFNLKYGNANRDEVMKKFKVEIQPRIDKLSGFVKRPIHGGTEDRVAAIKRLYGNITNEVNTIGGQGPKPIFDKPPVIDTPPIFDKPPAIDTPPIFDEPVESFSSLRAATGSFTTVSSTSILPEDSLTALNSFAGLGTTTETEPLYTTTAVEPVNQLWVRIYPDDVFIKTHEEFLTPLEQEAGRLFWKTWWAASNDYDLELAGWKTLCTALGTKRASWVARELDPRIYRSNGEFMQQKPSLNMTDAINIITTVNTELKAINTNLPPGDIFFSLQQKGTLLTLTTNLQQTLSELNTLSSVQVFLVEKFRVLLVQTASVISLLIERSQALTDAQKGQFSTTLAALQNLVNGFNAIQNRAQQIQAIDDKVFVNTVTDPMLYPQPNQKPRDWTMAPTSNVLPDRFVVITVKDGAFKHVAVGNQIPQDLQLGLDPNKFTDGSGFGIDPNGNLNIDPGLKWMVDYPEAVLKGMGITLTLNSNLYNNGIDKLIVVGVKNTDANNSKLQLEKLLLNHIYSTDGMSFLKTGTPTNNTHLKKSGYAMDDDVEQRFNIEIREWRYDANQTNPFIKSDGKYFCDALGITNGVTQRANDAGNYEIANALAMNRSLWSGTMGHYMEEMWDTLFSYDNIRRTENFFTRYVTGRGLIPAIRIGAQPYGVLATTAFSQLQLHSALPPLSRSLMPGVTPWDAPAALEHTLQARFEWRLHNFLKMLQGIWQEKLGLVMHSGNLHSGSEPQQRFISMLGLHATSLDYFYRYSLNVAKGPNMIIQDTSTNFTSLDPAGPTGLHERFKELVKQGVFFPSFDFPDEDPAQNVGWLPWKVIDRAYSRIKEQFEGARLFDARHIDNSFPVTGSLIDTVPLSATSVLSNLKDQNINYIDWLLSSSANNILGGNDINNPARIPSNTMLFLMLRQSLLQAYQEAALNMLQKEFMLTETVRRESGNEERYFYRLPVNGVNRNHYLTKWHYMFRNLSDLMDTKAMDLTVYGIPFFQFIHGGPKSVANYVDRVRDPNPAMYNSGHQIFFDKVKKVREAMSFLKRVPSASLEILMAEHVDITSYRLDAWMLGLVHQRLQKQRALQPNGVFLGAYGYVENLKRDTNKQTVSDPRLSDFKLPAGKPVYKDPDNDGLIHAPSQGQAIAAAVLRNAYKTNTESGDVANRLSVNLSSARVRMALQLIDGIRNGQEVGALLGFQFERGLHERYKTVELDKFIQPFRKAFPLQQAVQAAANGAPGYVGLVVNGQAILDLVYDSIQWLGSNSNRPGITTVSDILRYNAYVYLPQKIKATIDGALAATDDKVKVYNAIIEEIDRMADAFDAMGDLAVSESVYQIVQGNHVRAAAVLTALSEGKNIPDPQVIETHRSGTVVTQRVLLNFTAVSAGTVPAGWPVKTSVRSLAEPSFNYWLGQSIGPAAKWNSVLTMINAQNPNLVSKIYFPLSGLDWQPIDFFELPGGEDELKDIMVNHYRKITNDYTSIMTVDTRERAVSWSADTKTISELFLLLKHLRNMLGNSRVAGMSDLKLPEDPVSSANPGSHNVMEYETRVTGALQALNTFVQNVQALGVVSQVITGVKAVNDVVVNAGDFTLIYNLLGRAVLLGFPNALSVNLVQQDTPEKRGTAILQHLINVLKQAQSRYQIANEMALKLPGYTTGKLKVEKLGELAKALLGKSFLAVPQYGVAGTEAISSQLALPAAQGIARHGGVVAVEDWLQNIGRIRKRLYDAQMLMQMSDLYDITVPSLRPVQLSYKPGDYWLGIEYPSNYVPEGDKLSLVLLNDAVFRVPGTVSYSSVIIDEWVEIIPTKDVTSGIVFNYNQPNAAAPQSMLLAVTPNLTNRWEWDDLVYTVIDTIELAKLRAVEPDHLDSSALNHVLPAISSEVAPPQLRNQDHNPLGVQVVMDFADVKPKTT